MNKYEYFLANVPGLPNAVKIGLVKHFGSEEALYRVAEEEILKVPGLKDKERVSLLQFRRTFLLTNGVLCMANCEGALANKCVG